MTKHSERKKIALMLDNIRGANWLTCGLQLVDDGLIDKKVDKDEVKGLRRYYAGGGSTPVAFFEHLSALEPDYKLTDFCELAEELRRRDIAREIESWKEEEGMLLRNLEVEKHNKLVNFFNKEGRSINGWRDFAGELDMDDVIGVIEQAIRDGNREGPTMALFDMIIQRNPEFKLDSLKKVLQDIGRSDCASILQPIIDKHKVGSQKTQKTAD